MPTHYDILEIGFEASTEEIRRAYRRLSKRYHPDVNGDAKWASDRFKRLHEAYSCLSDEEQRRAYDLDLQSTLHSHSDKPGYSAYHARYSHGESGRHNHSEYEKSTNPFPLYFFLIGILVLFFIGRLWLSSEKSLPASDPDVYEIKPFPSGEALEFLDFYKEYPQLISPEEAQAVFSSTLPEGYTDLLKCYLMEGDLIAFRRLLQRPSEP